MIHIMVDSASDCRDAELYDIFLPMAVRLGEQEYLDGVNLSADEFYAWLSASDRFPTTSQPSPDDFINIFESVKERGDALLYFAVSSGLSGTYQGARLAQSMVEYDQIYVIDTLAVTHMIGFLVAHARRLVEAGMAARDIATRCEELKARIRVYAGVDTLEYLKKGGRLSGASATIGTLANIKPIISATPQGTVQAVGKAIGVPRAIRFILDKIEADEVDPAFPIVSLYTSGEDNVRSLEQQAEQRGYTVSARKQIGPTIGTHVGPGVYGLLYVAK